MAASKRASSRNRDKHPDVVWRGYTLKEWIVSTLTTGLRTANSGEYNEPQIELRVRYKGGVAVNYDATIRMNQAEANVYNLATAEAALEEARLRIMGLANSLQPYTKIAGSNPDVVC